MNNLVLLIPKVDLQAGSDDIVMLEAFDELSPDLDDFDLGSNFDGVDGDISWDYQ